MKKIDDWDHPDFQKNLKEELNDEPMGNGCWWVLLIIGLVWIGVYKIIEFFL